MSMNIVSAERGFRADTANAVKPYASVTKRYLRFMGDCRRNKLDMKRNPVVLFILSVEWVRQGAQHFEHPYAVRARLYY